MKYTDDQRFHAELNLDITTRCNLACSQCFRSALSHPHKAFDKEEVVNRIRESTDVSLETLHKIFRFSNHAIALCGTLSDPIMHPQFLDILGIMTEYPKVQFRIATAANGASLEWYKHALDITPTNCRWVFGLDGFSDTSMIYRENQNSQMIFDAMMYGHSIGVDVTWQFIVFDYNINDVDSAIQYCKDHRMRMVLLRPNRDSSTRKEIREVYDFRV